MDSPPVVSGRSPAPPSGRAQPSTAAVGSAAVVVGASSIPVPHVTGPSPTPQHPGSDAAQAPVRAAVARPASVASAPPRAEAVHVTAPAELPRAAVSTPSPPHVPERPPEPERTAERPRRRRGAPKGAPPKSADDKTVSKAQQRMAFARRLPWAHAAAKSGAAFKALPDHKRI